MPKQKPNELCACGSGDKYKKCCAARAALPVAGAARRHAAPAETVVDSVPPDMERLYREGCAAQQAGEWARAQRRATSALLAGGAWLCAGHVADAVLCWRFRCTFTLLLEVQGHPGRCLGEAQDCYARSLAMLYPPRTFWVRALTTLAHAGWRDTPLGADDVRITLPAAMFDSMLRTGLSGLSALHLPMAEAFKLAAGHSEDAIVCYERTMEALALEPENHRSFQMAHYLQNIGMLHETCGRAPKARECYARGLRLVEHSREEGIQPLQSVLRSLVHAAGGYYGNQLSAADVQGCEELWAKCPPDAENQARREALDLCCSVLSRTEHEDVQRPWLLRGTGMHGASLAQKSAAMLRCRACGAGAAETKLRLCAGCSRVAYCGAACQAADWNARHKKLCTGRHAGTPEAALSDAVCVFCRRALVPEEHAQASASQYERCELLLCLHFAHTACRQAGAGCPACR
jgi:hypothetical protein